MTEEATKLTEEQYAEMFLAARVKGYSDRAIANTYGVRIEAVRHLIKRTLKKIEIDNIEKLRRQEVAKLDQLEAVAMRAALNEQGIHDSRATKSALAIAARRSRLLGLDRPSKMELSGADGEPLQQTLFYIPHNFRDDNGMPLVPAPDEVAV